MKDRYRLNIDRLEICYTASISTAEELKDTAFMEREGYRLIAQESENKETILQVEVLEPNSTEWLRFGTLKIGSTFEDEDAPFRYVWIKIDNMVLYTPLYPTTSIASFLYFITEDLSLSYNNITRLDIAVDSSVNYPVRIKKAIRDLELTPVILRKAYPEPKEIIDKLLYIHSGDRLRYRTTTISISSKDKDTALCAYNKTEEIQESGKDYITEWDEIKPTIYRLEVRLKRAALIDYLEKRSLSFEDIYYRLLDKELLFDMFLFYSDRLLHFRKGRSLLSVLDVCA